MTSGLHRYQAILVAWLWGAVLLVTRDGVLAQVMPAPALESRYRIERDTSSSIEADTGYFEWCTPDPVTTDAAFRIESETGAEVGHQVLWANDGEPTKVRFDCSGRNSRYYVSLRRPPAPPPPWVPASGLVLETRSLQPGEPTNLPSLRQICQASGPILGRSLIPEVFLGIHPHGPSSDFASTIRGVFVADKAGEYDFATISDDASCLLIDDRPVAGWYGWHGCHEGRHGQHHGRVTLAAGRHTLEYLNANNGEGYTIEAAWRPPGEQTFAVMPARCFAPVASYHVAAFEAGAAEKAPVRFRWDITGHFTIGPATFVNVRFRSLSTGDRCTWVFDDGTKTQGDVIEHVFLSPGLRQVTLQVQRNGSTTALTQPVRVHRLWTQEKEQPRHLYKEQRRRLAQEYLGAAPPADLVSACRIAMDEEDQPVVKRFAALCVERAREFDKDQSAVFRDIAMFVQRPDLQEYALAQQAFDIVIRSPYSSPEQKAWASVHLAGLLVQYADRPDEADALLGTVEAERLSETDRRLKRIYAADVLFAKGRSDAARDAYAAIGTSYAPGDTAQALKRNARLETARDYLRHGEFDDAEQMIRCIEWEAPEQRMAGEPGLLMVRICMGRKEFARALLLARKLLPVAETDARKADLLLATIEITTTLGRTSEAEAAYRALLDTHPYSEAAATARDRWGRQFDAHNK